MHSRAVRRLNTPFFLCVQVITYIWAKEEEGQFQPGRSSRWWLYKSLQALEAQVRSKGSYICFRRGPCAVKQLLEVCKESNASVVFFNNVYDPLSLVRDHDVKRRLSEAGVVARSFNGELLYEPWEVLQDNGQPFTTFAGFWHKCVTCCRVACTAGGSRFPLGISPSRTVDGVQPYTPLPSVTNRSLCCRF